MTYDVTDTDEIELFSSDEPFARLRLVSFFPRILKALLLVTEYALTKLKPKNLVQIKQSENVLVTLREEILANEPIHQFWWNLAEFIMAIGFDKISKFGEN